MRQREKAGSLKVYRSALRTTGDVSVGAFARHQRRRRILIGVVGLVLIGGAVGLYWVLRAAGGEESTVGYAVMVECVKCGWKGPVNVKAGEESFPLLCPKCKERSCYKLWQCRDCGHQFLHKGGGAMLRCPRPECRSRRVGAADLPANDGGGD